MNVVQLPITRNEYSRPGRQISEVLGIVMHWTAAPRQNARQVRDYFERKKDGTTGYGSAHYIVDQSGEVLQCIPDNETAYHCGSATYTDDARRRFGKYCSDTSSPNNCTIGVELCPTDDAGNFTANTINAAVELCAELCRRYQLQADAITTHNAVVGWKNCPKLWTEKPQLFTAFVESVRDYMARS